MGPSQICGCPFREPRVFTIAHIRSYKYYQLFSSLTIINYINYYVNDHISIISYYWLLLTISMTISKGVLLLRNWKTSSVPLGGPPVRSPRSPDPGVASSSFDRKNTHDLLGFNWETWWFNICLVVWNICYFPFHIWDNPSQPTHIFQRGWNHHPDMI